MKLWILLLVASLCLVSGIAGAAEDSQTYYDVKMQISRDGNIIATPNSIAYGASPVEMAMNEGDGDLKLKYTVLKSHVGKDGRLVHDIDVQVLDKVQGNWVSRSSVQVEAYDGQEASIELPYEDAVSVGRTTSIHLTAKRMSADAVASMFDGKLPKPRLCPAENQGETDALASAMPQANGSCCSVHCSSRGDSLTCCGAVSCCACGVCCKTP